MNNSNSTRPMANLSDQALQLRALLNEKRSTSSLASDSRDHRPIKTTTEVPPKVVQSITGIVSPRQTPPPNITSPRGGIFFGDGQCEHDEDVVKPISDRGIHLAHSEGGGIGREGLSNIPVPRWSSTKPSVRKLKASSNDRKKQKAEGKQEKEQIDHHGIEEGILGLEDVPMTSDQENRSRRSSDEYKEISMKAQVLRAFLNPKKNKKDPIKREWIETEEPIVAQTGISNLESDLPDSAVLQGPLGTQNLAHDLLSAQKDLEDVKNENFRLQSENERLIRERSEQKLEFESRDKKQDEIMKETEMLKNQLNEMTSEMKTKEERIEQLEREVFTNQEDLLSQEKQILDLQEVSKNEKLDLENKMKDLGIIYKEEIIASEEKALNLENQLQSLQAAKDEENLSMEQKLAENEEKLNEVYTNLHNERKAREKCEQELKALSIDFENKVTKFESLEAEKYILTKQIEDQDSIHKKELQDQKDSLLQDVKIQEGIAEIFQRENERLIKELHDCGETSKTELNKLREKLKKLEQDKSDQLEQISKLDEQLQFKDDILECTKNESNKIIEALKIELNDQKNENQKLVNELFESEKKVAESFSLVQIHSSLQNNLEKSFQDMLNNFENSFRQKIVETVSEQLLDNLSKENEPLKTVKERAQSADEVQQNVSQGADRARDGRTTTSNQEMMELNQQYQIQLQNCATVLKILRKTVLQW